MMEVVMTDINKQRSVDLLVEKFWKQGYLTVSRKYGTYLPEPSKVGNFDVDIIARYKRNYAIGITLTEADLKDPKILEKLNYLATRQTKFTNKRVLLFVGVPNDLFKLAKELIDFLDDTARKNIRLFPIVDKYLPSSRKNKKEEATLFS
jgi:hypothetical protein